LTHTAFEPLTLKTGSGFFSAGLPDLSCRNIPKRGKTYQMTTNCSIWPYNIPNGCQAFVIAIKYTNNFHSKDLQNIPKLVFLV
jgi:hypothetical protein